MWFAFAPNPHAAAQAQTKIQGKQNITHLHHGKHVVLKVHTNNYPALFQSLVRVKLCSTSGDSLGESVDAQVTEIGVRVGTDSVRFKGSYLICSAACIQLTAGHGSQHSTEKPKK